ncbi:hypothetical protein ACQCN2_17010 [Brevibacillus ginsengisoli]
MTSHQDTPTSLHLAWQFIQGVAIALFVVALVPFLAIYNLFDL